ncbi:DUF5632 domain-containing protein [Mycobacterium servetii]|uniref:DUF5632 domain-containing protein n=1 Tax=Mycobacterium servetii TaxID=3237418 RepID=A0ABV4BTI0_9MYCO
MDRITARRRLRRATRESLAIPAFSAPVDCTPWVTGGLWPALLSPVTAETATLAEYLKADLQRIVESANDVLKRLQRAGLVESIRQEEEARIVDEARALAVQRVESTIRQLHALRGDAPVAGHEAAAPQGRHRATASGNAEQEAAPAAEVTPVIELIEAAGAESADQRLRRLLTFAARQAPRLNWAVGDRADGSTVLVTDLAHGWIPPGIALPADVGLLPPERRTGTVAGLVGDVTRVAAYAPGDRLGWPDDLDPTTSSVRPRELPPVPDGGRVLSDATRGRAGLPRLVHALAAAAAGGTRVLDDEVDLLRVHLDTALHQLSVQHPGAGPGLLLDCLLLAATEAAVTGDATSANYHLAWFQKLDAAPGE